MVSRRLAGEGSDYLFERICVDSPEEASEGDIVSRFLCRLGGGR